MEGKCSDSHAGGSNLLSSTCFLQLNLPWKIHTQTEAGMNQMLKLTSLQNSVRGRKLALEYLDRVSQTAEPVSHFSLFKFMSESSSTASTFLLWRG